MKNGNGEEMQNCKCDKPSENVVRVCAHCYNLPEDDFYVECLSCGNYVREAEVGETV